MLQLGYLNPQAFPSFEDFLTRLDSFLAIWPKDVPIAVEIRNKHWFAQDFAGCLRRHGASWVIADQAWTPPTLTLVKKLDVVTGR